MWERLLNTEIELDTKDKLARRKKIIDEKEQLRIHARDKDHTGEHDRGILNLFKDTFTFGVTKVLSYGAKDETQAEAERDAGDKGKIVREVVMNVIRMFTNYMVSYQVNPQNAMKLVKSFGYRYSLDPKHVFEFLLEIQTHQQPTGDSTLNIPVSPAISLRKRHLQRVEYKGVGLYLGLGQAVKYVGEKRTLLNILLLKKSISQLLRTDVLRRVLLLVPLPAGSPERLRIWAHVLGLVLFIRGKLFR